MMRTSSGSADERSRLSSSISARTPRNSDVLTTRSGGGAGLCAKTLEHTKTAAKTTLVALIQASSTSVDVGKCERKEEVEGRRFASAEFRAGVSGGCRVCST